MSRNTSQVSSFDIPPEASEALLHRMKCCQDTMIRFGEVLKKVIEPFVVAARDAFGCMFANRRIRRAMYREEYVRAAWYIDDHKRRKKEHERREWNRRLVQICRQEMQPEMIVIDDPFKAEDSSNEPKLKSTGH